LIEPYHLHPAAVHFPIALLATGLAVAGLRMRRSAPEWLAPAESWLLWLGTLSAWAALALGLLAERTAPHKPLAWEVLADHKTLAWWTCGVFTVLSALRGWLAATRRDGARWRAAVLLLWLAGFGLLFATAQHGGELAYRFGMGVDSGGGFQ
jgi:uncharacterized membrane protein